MNEYKIQASTTEYPEIYGKYMAVFEGYDGAPIDHETPSDDKIGYGDTELEAMFDLLEKSI
jgi:hypothetical protein